MDRKLAAEVQLYLFPFGVSVLDPLHRHTLIVLMQ